VNHQETDVHPSKFFACALLIAASAATQAQMSPNMAMAKAASAPSAAAPALTEAVVQNVDKPRGVVTLKHGEIVNMKMPAMTMAFNVADKKMLDNVKTGDKVRFRLENVSGAPTVTRIEPAQ
jgi:Cu(I)/Ag(I) efflux system membrane protein CusA/SilA